MNDRSVTFQIDGGAIANILLQKVTISRDILRKMLALLVKLVNQKSYSVEFDVLLFLFWERMELITVNYDNKHVRCIRRRIRWRLRNLTRKSTPSRARGSKTSAVFHQKSASYTQTEIKTRTLQNGWESSDLSHRGAASVVQQTFNSDEDAACIAASMHWTEAKHEWSWTVRHASSGWMKSMGHSWGTIIFDMWLQ